MTDDIKDHPPQKSARPDQHHVPGWESEAAAMRAKSEKLRALRLARDAASPPPPPKKVAARKGAAKKPAKSTEGQPSTLSAWIEDQQKTGRRT